QIKHVTGLRVHIFNSDLTFFAERHGPIAAKTTAGVYRNRDGMYRRVFAFAHPKEVAHGYFYRRLGFAIPVNAQNSQPPVIGWGHPYMLNGALPVYLSQRKGLAGFYFNAGIQFPALPKLTCLVCR